MSSTTYKNEYGNDITSAQANQLANYSQVIIDDNNQKIINTFVNGVLNGTTYTISSENDIAQILLLNPNASFTIASVTNGYDISESQSYKDGQLIYKNKAVGDSSGNCICVQNYDINTGLPVYMDTIKTYYDETGTSVYEFVYNNDGSCSLIDQIQVIDFGAEFLASQIGTDPDITFTWEGFEYYQNAEPLIPGN